METPNFSSIRRGQLLISFFVLGFASFISGCLEIKEYNNLPGAESGAESSGLSVPATAGRSYVYALNATDSKIHAFEFRGEADGLVELADSPHALGAGLTMSALQHSADGKFLYAIGYDSVSAYSRVFGFSVAADGKLTAIAGSPWTGGSAGQYAGNATIDHRGAFMYVNDVWPEVIEIFSINPATGALTYKSDAAPAAGGNLAGIIAHPARDTLYTTVYWGQSVSAQPINPTTGGVGSALAGSPVAIAHHPYAVAIDRTGSFLLAGTGGGAAKLHAFTIDSSSGAVAATPGSPIALNGDSYAPVTHPTRDLIYVLNGTSSPPLVGLNPANGALSSLTSPTLSFGSPSSLDFAPSGEFAAAAFSGGPSDRIALYDVDLATGGLRLKAGTAVGSVPGAASVRIIVRSD